MSLRIMAAGLGAGLGILCCAGCRSGEDRKEVDTEPSEARILADREAVAAGEGLELGILVTLAGGWHTYADPPGDSGMAPMVRVAAPEGFSAGAVKLPPHQTFEDEAGRTFGYERAVLLRVPVQAPADMGGRTAAEFEVRLDYLICKDECVPRRAVLSVSLPVRDAAGPVTEAWKAALKQGSWMEP